MICTDRGDLFAKYAIGDLTLVALSDGCVDMPPSRLRHGENQTFGTDLPADIPLYGGQLRLSVNAFLVEEQNSSLLIDTGASNAWLPTMGRLLGALSEAGVSRERITDVALTHTHEDHVNGLVAPDGSDTFPNLQRLLVPRDEIGLFREYARLSRFHDQCKPVDDGAALTKYISARSAVGHEIGHTAYEISTRECSVLVWGDLVHVPAVQFSRPELTWELDANQNAARETRLRFLESASASDTYVAGAHLDFPGVGSVTRKGKSFGFQSI